MYIFDVSTFQDNSMGTWIQIHCMANSIGVKAFAEHLLYLCKTVDQVSRLNRCRENSQDSNVYIASILKFLLCHQLVVMTETVKIAKECQQGQGM